MVVVSKHLAFSSFSILHLLLSQIPHVNCLSVCQFPPLQKEELIKKSELFKKSQHTEICSGLSDIWSVHFQWLVLGESMAFCGHYQRLLKNFWSLLEITAEYWSLWEWHSVSLPWVELKFRILWFAILCDFLHIRTILCNNDRKYFKLKYVSHNYR